MTRIATHPAVSLTIQGLPQDLHETLNQLAEKNHRSLDAQVVHMLIRGLAVEAHLDRASELMDEIRRHGRQHRLDQLEASLKDDRESVPRLVD